VTFTREQAVQELAEVIRVYPRRGGPFPDGGKLLQNRRRTREEEWNERRTKKQRLSDWSRKGAANPEVVADLLLGISLDGTKATESAFKASELIAQKYQWSLSFDDDIALGTYLISCLVKVGYYKPKQLWGNNFVSLHVRKNAIVGFAETDAWLSRGPLKRWSKAIDDEGRRLVSPSRPQLKRTEYKPSAKHFEGNENLQLVLEATGKNVDVYQNAPSVWVRAVMQLERNPYSINQKVLEVVNKIASDPKRAPPRTDPEIEKDIVTHKEKYIEAHRKAGIWKDIKKKEHRTLGHLNHLLSLEIESRKEKDDPPQIYLTDDQRERINEHIGLRRSLARIRNQIEKTHLQFKREVRKANDLGTEPFFQRAFADSRGRLYLSKSRVNYQSGDLCRGLLQFSEGAKVPRNARKHLWVHLANTYGVKGTEKERAKRGEKLRFKALRYAKNPIDTYDEWSEAASDKWQFIRACFEVRDVLKEKNHVSHLIVEIDQSMSALQHIALIRGDADLADRVNMGTTHHDAYQEVADGIRDLDGQPDNVKRKIVKLAFMGWVYGGNWTTAAKRYHASIADIKFLQNLGWQRRADLAVTVVRALNAHLPGFGNYKKALRDISRNQLLSRRRIPHARWITPSGFEVRYYSQQTKTVRPYIAALKDGESATEGRPATIKLRAKRPLEAVDEKKLIRAMAPNFVHSVDATVAHYVLMRVGEAGDYVVSVHDAFGTHLKSVRTTAKAFRDYLVELYGATSTFNPPALLSPALSPMIEEKDYRKMIDKAFKSPHIIDGLI
jgi:hypothetical protein